MKKRSHRKVLAAALAMLLILTGWTYTDLEMAAAEETPQSVITAITDSSGLPLESSYAATTSVGDSDPLDTFLWKMLYVYATVEGVSTSKKLSVGWDYNTLIAGINTPGTYTCTAPISADGHTFAEGIPQTVTVVITVTEAIEKEPDVIASFDDFSHREAYAISQGSDWQEFWDAQFSDYRWEQSWPCYTEDGETLYAHITWDDPMPDTSQTGVVTVQGTAVLPENSVLAEGAVLPTAEVPVSIQAEPTLDCWYATADVVHIPWVMGKLKNEDSLKYLASVNGGSWEDATQWMDTDGESVCIWIWFLEEGSTYQVKVSWDGGETNTFEFTWNGSVTDEGPVEGDRDGGDTDGNPSADISQPAPETPEPSASTTETPVPSAPTTETPKPESTPATPEATGDSTPANPQGSSKKGTPSSSTANTGVLPKNDAFYDTFIEESTDAYSLLSGARLALMRQAGAVRFSKQGVTVTLSDAALDNMKLADDSRFLIQAKKTEKGFSLAVTLDGQEISSLPDTQIQLPFTPENENALIALLDEQGNTVCYGTYDSALGIVSFIIHEPGSYTIAEGNDETVPVSNTSTKEISETAEQPSSGLLLPAVVLSLAALLTGLFLLQRRRR